MDVMDQVTPRAEPETDIVTVTRNLLAQSAGPMTLARIYALLPASVRPTTPEALADSLQRQVAANVLYAYPKYRSPQDRYWDRPMKVHLRNLVCGIVEGKPLSWSEILRKLPDYARLLAGPVLDELLADGSLHRHPPVQSRQGPRFGLHRADPKVYLRPELERTFARLEKLGLTRTELRECALEILHDEEWYPRSQALPGNALPGGSASL